MVQIKWNMQAFKEIRKSPEVKKILKNVANNIATKSNSNIRTEGYFASVVDGKNRSRASVITSDSASIKDNAKNNTLLRELGSTHV